MKADILKNKTLTQYLKFSGHNWNTLENKKIISNRTYYRLVRGESRPQKRTIEKITKFLDIDEKTFLQLLNNDVKVRQK